MAQLQFLRLLSYQSQPIGSVFIYIIEPPRPIGYAGASPFRLAGKWRSARWDTSAPQQSVIALDLGIYVLLDDAMGACQADAELHHFGLLAWTQNQSYQSKAVNVSPWIYNISQPSPGPDGTLNWRALKRDLSLPDAFQAAITLGTYGALADAQAACQADWDATNLEQQQ
jgi:hypothetical protein